MTTSVPTNHYQKLVDGFEHSVQRGEVVKKVLENERDFNQRNQICLKFVDTKDKRGVGIEGRTFACFLIVQHCNYRIHTLVSNHQPMVGQTQSATSIRGRTAHCSFGELSILCKVLRVVSLRYLLPREIETTDFISINSATV